MLDSKPREVFLPFRTHRLTVTAILVFFAAGCTSGPAVENRAYLSPEDFIAKVKAEKRPGPSSLLDSLKLSVCGGNCSGEECPQFSVFHPKLEQHGKTALVKIVCFSQQTYLVVLREETAGKWRWVDTAPLMDRYGYLRIGFASTIKAPVEEVIIRNEEGYAGTGAFAGVFMILKLAEDRLRVVFTTGDSGQAMANMTDIGTDVSQDLEWTNIQQNGLLPELRVTTNYRANGLQCRVVHRYFWNERWQMFLAGYPDEIEQVAGRAGRRHRNSN